MIYENISPQEKECIHKCEQRRHWSPEMRLKVQEYDHNCKRQQAQKSTPSPAACGSRQMCKVSLQQNENGFKKSIKKLFTIGLNSPKKREFMFDYFGKHGIKVTVKLNQIVNVNLIKLSLFFNLRPSNYNIMLKTIRSWFVK